MNQLTKEQRTETKIGEIDTTPRVCGHCNTNTIFSVIASDTTNTESEIPETMGGGTFCCETRYLRLIKCQTCSKATLEETVVNPEEWYPEYKPLVDVLYPVKTNPYPPATDLGVKS